MSEHQTMKSIGSVLATVKGAQSLTPMMCLKHGKVLSSDGKTCHLCEDERLQAIAQTNAAAARRAARMKSIVYHSGIPPRFRTKTFDGFVAEDEKQRRVLRICKAYADRFDERYAAGGGMVMCGSPGTGKTHLACAIGNQLLELGRSVLFVSVLGAVRSVKETWRPDSGVSERSAIERFFEPDLLVLDEVGVQFGSEAERIVLYDIINGRYERVQPTILISNLPESDLGGYLTDRLVDRMAEGGGVTLAFDWPSKRSTIKTASRDMPAWTA